MAINKTLICVTLLAALLVITVYKVTLGKHPDGDCLDPKHERFDPRTHYTN